ncbi:MAG: disulfide bond formation protein B [Pseudomonadota bacterium]
MALNAHHVSYMAFSLPAALLLGALGFQYFGGLAPCDLCIDQRWAHLAACGAGLCAVVLHKYSGVLTGLSALGMLASGIIAVNHSGVERKWWSGPSSCSGNIDADLSPEAYLEAIKNAPIVSCGDIAWSFAGLSMANYNAIISISAAIIIGIYFWLTRQSSSSTSQ